MSNFLRPQNLKEFIGQEKIKNTLDVIIQSARKRKASIDHIIFYGQAGVGKTTLANIVANESQRKIKYVQGPMLEKKSDILSLLGSIIKNDIIFIDELHGINRNVEEMIYSALEDGVIDIMIGPEGDSKIIRFELPSFTLVGATTQISKISLPLRERFGIVFKLLPYREQDILIILTNLAKQTNYDVEEEALKFIASYSRLIPRVANNLLKRVIDFAVVKNQKKIDKKIVQLTFDSIGLYKYGLTDTHLNYLKILVEIFEKQYASLDSIAGVTGESKDNIEQYIEPLLIKFSFIKKTSRGRSITSQGIKYLVSCNMNNGYKKIKI